MENNVENKKPNKKNLIIIISIVVLSLIITSMSILFISKSNTEKSDNKTQEIDNIQNQNNLAFLDYEETVEYKTKWTYEEILNNLIDKDKLSEDTTIKVSIDEEELIETDILEFNKVGDFTITILLTKEYNNKEIEVKKEYTLKVEDTIYPVIEGVENKTITVGDTIDLLTGITATDEVEGELTPQVDGVVDTSKAGTYTIKVYAVDANGNRTEKEYTLTIKEKTTTSSGSSSSKTTTKKTTTKASSSGSSSSSGCTYTNTLSKRGYNKNDKDACAKDKEASAKAKQIADSIKAKGYTTDWEKVRDAAAAVSNYYYSGVHVESGYDYRTPYGVFIKGESSCAGCTRALIQVLEYLGFTNLVHMNANSWTHQWVKLTIDGEVGYADGQVGWYGTGCHPSDSSC